MHQFSSFEEFWPFYLSEHRSRRSRLLHYLGTCFSLIAFILIVAIQQWSWLPIILIIGYGPAWIGHFVIEKNRPATFKHPLWSLRGDYKMLAYAITGRLQRELQALPEQKHPSNPIG